jgi:hypothetical protein
LELKLNFEIPKANFEICHGSTALFLGSCFSDEMFQHARYTGWKSESNPFGTIYHPKVLADFIHESITGVQQERIIKRDDLYFSWDANSIIYGDSENELGDKLNTIRKSFVDSLKEASVLFVTFGTAWGYNLKDTDETVANCHKFPSREFDKILSECDELYSVWNDVNTSILEINPTIKLVFTISPVRHIRDGLVENNQSKAVLFELIRKLTQLDTCSYFPSYEIMIDELRDYRFFKPDKIHPTQEAVEYIWSRLVETYCSKNTLKLNEKVRKLRQQQGHRSLHPTSRESILFKDKVERELNELKLNHPEIVW